MKSSKGRLFKYCVQWILVHSVHCNDNTTTFTCYSSIWITILHTVQSLLGFVAPWTRLGVSSCSRNLRHRWTLYHCSSKKAFAVSQMSSQKYWTRGSKYTAGVKTRISFISPSVKNYATHHGIKYISTNFSRRHPQQQSIILIKTIHNITLHTWWYNHLMIPNNVL